MNFPFKFSSLKFLSQKFQHFKMKLFSFWNYFIDFTENCTIQGLKYVGQKNRHWVERAFWIVSIFASFIACSYTIKQIFTNWNENPVVITFAEKATSVSQIPFPAITVCPISRIDRDVFNMTNIADIYYKNGSKVLSQSQLKSLEAATHMCSGKYMHSKLKGLKNETFLPSNEIVKEIEKISTDGYLSLCSWRGAVNCDKIFSKILTEESICYTFKNLDYSELLRQEK